MEEFKPVPCPPSHRWREFRINFMPLVVFAGVLAVTVLIWRDHVAPPSLVGEVEAFRSSVTSAQPGTLVELNVEAFRMVTNGQIIGKLAPSDPAMLKAITDAYEA